MWTPSMLGTVSHGTMRPEDLIPEFYDALGMLSVRAAKEFRKTWKDCLENPEREDAPECVDALFDAINAECPPYIYFGAAEGDGSDYGFWPAVDSLEDDARFRDGVIKLNSGDPIPKGNKDYVMFVSDHGNVTFCNHKGREIWSCV